MASNDMSIPEAIWQERMRPLYWLPDILHRTYQRIYKDFLFVSTVGEQPFTVQRYIVDDTPISRFANILEQRQKHIKSLGYGYLGVIIPSRQSVYALDHVSKVTLERGRLVAAELESRGYPLINLFDKFSGIGGRDYYFKHDSHWNSKGVDVAANMIVQGMRSRFPELNGVVKSTTGTTESRQ